MLPQVMQEDQAYAVPEQQVTECCEHYAMHIFIVKRGSLAWL